jgi:hypothetical protein
MDSIDEIVDPDIQSLVNKKDTKGGILNTLSHSNPKIRSQAEKTFFK